ncbi:hypothetical protein L596_019673 [Steinernema carpocapsae]|uniref:Uncharacterized protein n=1 Tax=Steinernema carpocapsae TaxID=34508 RepID=A0A4U5MRF4_STECR|nr:hypothetical protein L596_019673 [Steinernema carpocapsae]
MSVTANDDHYLSDSFISFLLKNPEIQAITKRLNDSANADISDDDLNGIVVIVQRVFSNVSAEKIKSVFRILCSADENDDLPSTAASTSAQGSLNPSLSATVASVPVCRALSATELSQIPSWRGRSLYHQFGSPCRDFLIDIVGKFPKFYRATTACYLSDLAPDLKLIWSQIMAQLRSRYPTVPETLAYACWRTIRVQYNSAACSKTITGRIPYLERENLYTDYSGPRILPYTGPQPNVGVRILPPTGIHSIQEDCTNGMVNFRNKYGFDVLATFLQEIKNTKEFMYTDVSIMGSPSQLPPQARMEFDLLIVKMQKRWKLCHIDAFNAWRDFRNQSCAQQQTSQPSASNPIVLAPPPTRSPLCSPEKRSADLAAQKLQSVMSSVQALLDRSQNRADRPGSSASIRSDVSTPLVLTREVAMRTPPPPVPIPEITQRETEVVVSPIEQFPPPVLIPADSQRQSDIVASSDKPAADLRPKRPLSPIKIDPKAEQKFMEKHGIAALDLLFTEIGKTIELMDVNVQNLKLPSHLPDHAKQAWIRIMQTISNEFSKVSYREAFEVWQTRQTRGKALVSPVKAPVVLPVDIQKRNDNLGSPNKPVDSRLKRYLSPIRIDQRTQEEFKEKHGIAALNLLLTEISKTVELMDVDVQNMQLPFDLSNEAMQAWMRILKSILRQFPSVDCKLAFEVWQSMQGKETPELSNPNCPVPPSLQNAPKQRCTQNEEVIQLSSDSEEDETVIIRVSEKLKPVVAENVFMEVN